MLPITTPYEVFFDLDGKPLDNGYIYFGQPNQNPETSPVTVYWDEAGTIPASQPIRTSDGYIYRNGSPANVFIDGEYSILVRDKKHQLVSSAPSSFSFDSGSTLASPYGAALVGFSHAETYPSGTLGAKGKQVISVTDAPFNAVGDGVANDGAAANAALAALLAAGGGVLYFPPGTYKGISLNITSPGIYIRGAGKDASTLLPTTNTDCIRFAFIGGEGWGVSDLTIRYVGTQTSKAAINAGDTGTATVNGTVENVYIENPYDGITVANSQGTTINQTQIWYFAHYGVCIVDNANDIYLSQLFLNGAQFGTSTPGTGSIGIAALAKAHGIMAAHIEIIQCSRPMLLQGPNTVSVLRPAFSTFHDCFFDSSTNPVYVNYCRNIKFSKCWFSQRDRGCLVDNSVDTTFESCTFANNDKEGCVVNASAVHTRFVNCTFDSNGQGGVSKNGLRIADGAVSWSVIGGVAGNLGGGFPATQDVGIGVGSGTDKYTVRDVNFSGNTFSPMFFTDLPGANTGLNRRVKDNIGYETRTFGTSAIAIGTTSIVVNHGLITAPRADQIMLSATNNTASTPLYVDTTSITSSQFTVRCASAALGTLNFVWQANCLNG